MPNHTVSRLVEHLRRMGLDREERSDSRLLEHFVTRRDESAFTCLVQRHGPMVLGVCRRVLGNVHDAEDACQAAFLVLARKAGSVKSRQLLGNWLYGVAYRCALKARSRSSRRRAREKQVANMPEPLTQTEDGDRELQGAIDEELSRLPDKYRVPVVLCELEGRSRKEVARLLRIPEGTLSSRLATARKRLARRLAQRGLVISATALTAVLAPCGAQASLSTSMIRAVVQTAFQGTAAAKASVLANEVIKAMFMTKLKTMVGILLVLGAIGTGAGVVVQPTRAELPDEATPAGQDEPGKASSTDADKLQGAWALVANGADGKSKPEGGQANLKNWYFVGSTLYVRDGDRIQADYSYELHPRDEPKGIDLSPRATDTQKGIYRFEGNELQICLASNSHRAERPKTFETSAQNHQYLITFRRDANAPAPDLKWLQAERENRRERIASIENLRRIALAMHNYADNHEGRFPPSAIADAQGKPLLSWRVILLPYLNEPDLYRQFKGDEPWDSAHNKKMLARMPWVYGKSGDRTHYRVFTGPNTLFEGDKGIRIPQVGRKLTNTFLVVEAEETVPWTKPEDLPYDPSKPLPKLGGISKGGFTAASGDASVRSFTDTIGEAKLRQMIVRTEPPEERSENGR